MFSLFLDKGHFFLFEEVVEKKIFCLRDKEEMLKFLAKFDLGFKPKNPYVFHFFYESGFVFQNLDQELEIEDKTPLLLFIEYKKITKLSSLPYESGLKLEGPINNSFHDYQSKFEQGYEELLKGECYQFNLTIENKHHLEIDGKFDPLKILGLFWKNENKRGAFAHATYDGDKLYLSNSPECLYTIKSKNDTPYIVSMPIKGTVSLKDKRASEIPSLWKNLVRDKKNQAELFMISDLIRNDLSKIDLPLAKVIKRKAPLIVPGILHQFSVIECPLNKEITLLQILSALIPGGSITGAPKKNVMRILNRLEGYKRNFYCGSTILWHKNVHSASINIRSSVWDLNKKTVVIPAGGGVTLKSSVEDEFQELQDKLLSFKNLLY
jgi:para-aminobenzoate synthetase component 1